MTDARLNEKFNDETERSKETRRKNNEQTKRLKRHRKSPLIKRRCSETMFDPIARRSEACRDLPFIERRIDRRGLKTIFLDQKLHSFEKRRGWTGRLTSQQAKRTEASPSSRPSSILHVFRAGSRQTFVRRLTFRRRTTIRIETIDETI